MLEKQNDTVKSSAAGDTSVLDDIVEFTAKKLGRSTTLSDAGGPPVMRGGSGKYVSGTDK